MNSLHSVTKNGAPLGDSNVRSQQQSKRAICPGLPAVCSPQCAPGVLTTCKFNACRADPDCPKRGMCTTRGAQEARCMQLCCALRVIRSSSCG